MYVCLYQHSSDTLSTPTCNMEKGRYAKHELHPQTSYWVVLGYYTECGCVVLTVFQLDVPVSSKNVVIN